MFTPFAQAISSLSAQALLTAVTDLLFHATLVFDMEEGLRTAKTRIGNAAGNWAIAVSN